MINLVMTDKVILNDLEKKEAAEMKKRVLKPKDPNSTARAKVILDSEGKQTVQARTSKINADKKTGTGVLKVRYQVTDPQRR